jgi:hypothetical protein
MHGMPGSGCLTLPWRCENRSIERHERSQQPDGDSMQAYSVRQLARGEQPMAAFLRLAGVSEQDCERLAGAFVYGGLLM